MFDIPGGMIIDFGSRSTKKIMKLRLRRMIRVDRVDLVISIYCKKEKPKHVYLELPVWVPNGSERVSIYHPLGFKEGTLWKVLVNIYIYINMYDVCPDVQIPPEKVFRVFFGCPTNFSGGVWMSRVYIYI